MLFSRNNSLKKKKIILIRISKPVGIVRPLKVVRSNDRLDAITDDVTSRCLIDDSWNSVIFWYYILMTRLDEVKYDKV